MKRHFGVGLEKLMDSSFEMVTAWIDISHNAIFCVLGENGQVHQIERLQWSLLERTTHYWGKEPDRFKVTMLFAYKKSRAKIENP